jgi:hypothetical protein
MAEAKERTIEDRIRAIEDRLAIYNLIASHPPSADTGAQSYIRSLFADDGVLDLGGGKTATGNDTISEMSQRPAHQEAIRGGLAHFAGLPYVELDGDRAVVTSYLQIISPNTLAEPVEVPAHGVSKGYRIHRVGANRWELARTRDGWKIKRRVFRSLDGSDGALDILRQALAPNASAQ